MRECNEALDCHVYARAAAWILGADRWQEKVWSDLERQFPVAQRQQERQDVEAEAQPARRTPMSAGRAAESSGAVRG